MSTEDGGENEGPRRPQPFNGAVGTRQRAASDVDQGNGQGGCEAGAREPRPRQAFRRGEIGVTPVKTRYAARSPVTTEVSTPVTAAMAAPLGAIVSIASVRTNTRRGAKRRDAGEQADRRQHRAC